MSRILLILCLLALAAGAPAQKMYKWVDKDGNVQYTDTPPPPGAKTEKTMTAPKPVPGQPKTAATKPKSVAEQDAEFRKRQVEEAEARAKQDKTAAQDEQAKAQCITAKSNLTQLESGVRVAKYDANGERYFLEDTDRPKAIEEARRAVDSWCNPPPTK